MLVAFRSVNYVAQLLMLLHEQDSQCVVPFNPLTPRSDILLSLTPDDFTRYWGAV